MQLEEQSIRGVGLRIRNGTDVCLSVDWRVAEWKEECYVCCTCESCSIRLALGTAGLPVCLRPLCNWTRPDTRRFALEIFVPFILPSRQPTLSRIWTLFSSLHMIHWLISSCFPTFLRFCLIPIFFHFLQSESFSCISFCTCFPTDGVFSKLN
jgi:hypothetical protein